MRTVADGPTRDLEALAVAVRRDRLVLWACGWLVALQALPYVAVGWVIDGGTAAGDGALYALSPRALLGVVGFGVVLAVALSRPGLRPRVGPGAAAGGGAEGPLLASRGSGTARTTRSVLPRLRWAALASIGGAAAHAGAVLLDDAARSGAFAVGDALDDGSAVWAYVATVLHVLLMDVRAPLAVVVALVVLTRARRPVSPRGCRPAGPDRPGPAAPPGARTTRRSQGRPPS